MQQYYEVPELKNRDIRHLARKALKGKWIAAVIPMIIIVMALVLPSMFQYKDLLSSDLLSADSVQELQAVLQEAGKEESGLFYTFLSFFSFLCTGAFTLAAAALSVRILRNEEWNVKIAFQGFLQFIQAFVVDIWTNILSILWSLVTVLPGMMIYILCLSSAVLRPIGVLVFAAALIVYISRLLRYSLSYFIAQDNERLSQFQTVKYRVTLMRGNVWKYFSLQLSFIGWIVLASVPAGLGLTFLTLYSENGSVVMNVIAIALMILGMVTLAMMQLYVTTADAVFYSMISGNFGIAENDDRMEAAGYPAVEHWSESAAFDDSGFNSFEHPQPEMGPDAAVEAETVLKPEIEAGSNIETETVPQPEIEEDAAAEADIVLKPEMEADSYMEMETAPESEMEPDSFVRSDIVPATDSELVDPVDSSPAANEMENYIK